MELNSSSSSPGIDIGMPTRRDPDALPPGDLLEAIGGLIYYILSGLGKGNAVFAIKAGVLTGTCAHPCCQERILC